MDHQSSRSSSSRTHSTKLSSPAIREAGIALDAVGPDFFLSPSPGIIPLILINTRSNWWLWRTARPPSTWLTQWRMMTKENTEGEGSAILVVLSAPFFSVTMACTSWTPPESDCTKCQGLFHMIPNAKGFWPHPWSPDSAVPRHSLDSGHSCCVVYGPQHFQRKDGWCTNTTAVAYDANHALQPGTRTITVFIMVALCLTLLPYMAKSDPILQYRCVPAPYSVSRPWQCGPSLL